MDYIAKDDGFLKVWNLQLLNRKIELNRFN